jgi:APA family basic amino acid/polyamine antiporter
MSEKKQGQLVQTFGLGMAIMLVMSNIIGSGVFKKVAPMTAGLGSPGMVLLAWALAGLITIFGVLCAAEAASMFPESGGPYAWLGKMFGPVVGFSYGWSCFTVIQSAAIASIAVVFAQALDTFVPLFHLPESWESFTLLQTSTDSIQPFKDFGAKCVAVGLIAGLTVVNIRGAEFGAAVSRFFTGTIVIAILFVVAVGFFSGVGSVENLQTPAAGYPEAFHTTLSAFALLMVLAMRDAFWAYEGWISLGYLGGEIKNPTKNLPLALILGILGVIGIYLLINVAYLFVLPADELIRIKNEGNTIAAVEMMGRAMGSIGAGLISGFILISTFGCTNTTILSASRIYCAMAQKGEFFRSAGYVHHRYNTPSVSLVYQAVWASVLALSGSFDFLTNLLVFAAFVFYGLVAAGIVVLRIKMPDTARPYKTLGYPVVPIVFVAFCLVLLGVAFYESWQNALLGMLLILSGLPFYYFWKKNPQPAS